MRGVNLVLISGTVTSKPKPFDGGCVFKFSNVYKKNDYEIKANVEIVAYDDLSRVVIDNVTEGSKIYVEGKIKNLSKELPSGKTYYYTQIVAKEIQRL